MQDTDETRIVGNRVSNGRSPWGTAPHAPEVMIVTAHYDNSPNNRANPDPNQVIRWGDKSEEEMMTSWIEYLEAARAFSGTSSGTP
ncbi:MAG: hypothetical protein HY235_29665 [Acidobacteria bacterium]|nr:hypothetical protein [Acidobacteriota bacterium]